MEFSAPVTVTKRAAKCFSDVSNYPSLKTAWFDNEEGVYHAIWSQTHPVTKSKILSQRTVVNGFQTESVPVADYGLMALNRTKHNLCYKKAYICNKKEDKGTKSYLDVYTKSMLAYRHDLTSYEMHGKVNDDSTFGSLAWSPDATHLAYIAENKIPASKSFYDYVKKETEETVRGEEFKFTESWGEQLAEVVSPVICIIEIATGEINIPILPPNISPMDLVWSDTHLYFIGAKTDPFKLGLVFCTNREMALYSLDNITKECVAITGSGRAVYSPRLEQLTGKVVFLEAELIGPHRTYAALKVYMPGTKEIHTVPNSIELGIHADLHNNPWVDQHHILCNPTDKWRNITVCLDIRTGEPKYSLTEPDRHYSIIDQIGSKALVSHSGPNAVGQFQQQVFLLTIGARLLDLNLVFNVNNTVEETCLFKGYDFERDGRKYNGFLVSPKEKENDKNTLLVFPHGGPHGASVAAFSPAVHSFCKLGYSVLMVNYTGSLGIDRASVFSLAGNVGRVDVDDVHTAALQVIKEGGYTKVAVMGGSHGGFLTAHLIGQFPEVYQAAVIRNPVIDISTKLGVSDIPNLCWHKAGFKGYNPVKPVLLSPDSISKMLACSPVYQAAVMRNPVIDISTMSGVSDIPDWCWYEAGLDYNASKPALPSPESLTKMLTSSPIQFVDQIRCPVLLQIGAKDLRVPPSQGLRYYQFLKSRGVKTELFLYPEDCHSLASVATSADVFVQSIAWFDKHIK